MSDLVREQLVTRADTPFHYTKYRDVSCVLPTSRIVLLPPLSRHYIETNGLFTTDLLSFFGLYLHIGSGVLVCACQKKQSFAIRFDRYEIQDVINRSERNLLLVTNSHKENVHYINFTNRPEFKYQDPHPVIWKDLADEIELAGTEHNIPINYELERLATSSLPAVFPLLPVYVGLRRGESIDVVNLADEASTTQLAQNADKIVLFQRLYSILGSFVVSLHKTVPIPASLVAQIRDSPLVDPVSRLEAHFRFPVAKSGLDDFYDLFPSVLGSATSNTTESDQETDDSVEIVEEKLTGSEAGIDEAGILTVDRHVLVVGGGEVGLSRVNHLLQADAQITVVSPEFEPTIEKYAELGLLTLIRRKFEMKDLQMYELDTDISTLDIEKDQEQIEQVAHSRFAMVLTCLNDYKLSLQIYYRCRQLGLNVNLADKPKNCDFYFGSTYRQGPLQIMISSNGKAPRFTNRLKEHKLRPVFDGLDIRKAVENLDYLRTTLRTKIHPGESPAVIKARMEWNRNITDSKSIEEWTSMDKSEIDALLATYAAQ
ncbi:hypothetical protein OGAPHI_001850 [Ogataea philodendri]|uniref:precorrin-2 dehydrogenase n=1 Tax=Ogataea philodendri TaxID=1378263 RepID=A0A9P8PAC9_9ASCO|nr:uncharacterized protein OGAPHI_001850 [Ogataea philodendri]KAH3668096.1 hypothetical protein OGAPHI_001850 [Ogataea philodendri]